MDNPMIAIIVCSCVIAILCLIMLRICLDWLNHRLCNVGNFHERYILITGCDTGFGNLAAKRLDLLGCHVFAGCLTERGIADIQKCCSNRLTAILLDVTSRDSVKNAFRIVTETLPENLGLWGVVNNAGLMSSLVPIEWQPLEEYKTIADVNLFGLIDVTMTFLPLVKKARGRIVNTTSVSGLFSVVQLAPYTVTKFGVEAFNDTLRRSLDVYGVKVIKIEPGFHRNTCLFAGIDQKMSHAWNQTSAAVKAEWGNEALEYYLNLAHTYLKPVNSTLPNDVADAYEHALFDLFPRRSYLIGIDAVLLFKPLSVLPEWVGDWLTRLVELVLRTPVPKSPRSYRSVA